MHLQQAGRSSLIWTLTDFAVPSVLVVLFKAAHSVPAVVPFVPSVPLPPPSVAGLEGEQREEGEGRPEFLHLLFYGGRRRRGNMLQIEERKNRGK